MLPGALSQLERETEKLTKNLKKLVPRGTLKLKLVNFHTFDFKFHIDEIEFFSKIQQNEELTARFLTLTDKKTGAKQKFNLFDHLELREYGTHPIISKYDMSKLEVEYDYDTDSE